MAMERSIFALLVAFASFATYAIFAVATAVPIRIRFAGATGRVSPVIARYLSARMCRPPANSLGSLVVNAVLLKG